MRDFVQITGGVTAARGFRACGVEAGIKYAGRRDVAMIAADAPCALAAMFTSNAVKAAPVRVSLERERSGLGQVVVINSGNANACTGEEGLFNAYAMTRIAAAALAIDESLVTVCSTGVIGVELPMERVAEGIERAAAALSREGGQDAARAIMTTDTVDKQCAVSLEIDGRSVVIGGMAKGSGMIEPNMATMLAFVTTDANIDGASLKYALREAVSVSFNRLVVDGDQSTNDTVIALASAAAGNAPLSPAHRDWPVFLDALKSVCMELGRQIVMDGEGATRFVRVRVTGALSAEDAQAAARAIARSPLVKTAFYGADPNWGRIIAAVGYSGAAVDETRARISIGRTTLYDSGRVADRETLAAAADEMRARTFDVAVHLAMGEFSDTIYTCDLSHDYITINADYTT